MFNALSIFVADMATSLAFYRLIGLDIDAEADGQPHADHELPSGFRLMWDTHDTVRAFDPGFKAPSASGEGPTGLELAFQCESPEDVDRRNAAIVDAGYRSHLEPFDAFWGQRYAIVVDPDGHHVALYAPIETE